jgi:hypothetical protein
MSTSIAVQAIPPLIRTEPGTPWKFAVDLEDPAHSDPPMITVSSSWRRTKDLGKCKSCLGRSGELRQSGFCRLIPEAQSQGSYFVGSDT